MTSIASTLDRSMSFDISEKPCDSLTLYSQKIRLGNENIKSYAPLSADLLWILYEKKEESIIYEVPLSPTIVYKVVDKKTKWPYVVKELKKSRLKQEYQHEFAKNEMTLHYSMSKLSDLVTKIPHYFEDNESYYIVLEFSPHHNYFDELLEGRYVPIMNEGLLKSFSYDILRALALLHENNIIHCDVKPQNFLVFAASLENEKDEIEGEAEAEMDCNAIANPLDESNSLSIANIDDFEDYAITLKITDFGLSHIIPEGEKVAFARYACGTFTYKAPELTENSFIGTAVDMWSFGIMLYQMVTAYLPTNIKKYKFGSGDIPFRPVDWKHLKGRDEIQDLIKKCLVMAPEQRITAKEALNHNWFKEFTSI